MKKLATDNVDFVRISIEAICGIMDLLPPEDPDGLEHAVAKLKVLEIIKFIFEITEVCFPYLVIPRRQSNLQSPGKSCFSRIGVRKNCD
jgi:hypothetical protein